MDKMNGPFIDVYTYDQWKWGVPILVGSSQLVSGLVHPGTKWTLPLLSPFIARVITY